MARTAKKKSAKSKPTKEVSAAIKTFKASSEVENFYRKVLKNNPGDLNAGQRLANVLNEKGENKSAIELIENFIDTSNPSVSVLLMKLKLSLTTKTPAELGHFIDEILEHVKRGNV